MNVFLDLALPGLADALSELLPSGIEPRALHLDRERFRVDARGPFGVKGALVARVETASGRLTLHDVAFEGLGPANALVAPKLRRAIAALDAARGPFRARGAADGRTVIVTWSAADSMAP